MIIKFHNRGVGRGSGPVGYLLGRDGNREGATLDQGNPAVIEALIDSSPYAKNTPLAFCRLPRLIYRGDQGQADERL